MADTCFPLHDKEPVIDGIKFPKCVFEENLRRIQSMEVRDNDIWLISYPKTGTHWMKGILYQLFNHDTPEGHGGPHLQDYVKGVEFLDFATGKLRTEIISMMPLEERRYIATHLLPWFMPKQYLEKKPKTLYITRNPKDTALSLWHFAKIHDFLDTPESWDTYLEDFIEGNVIYGSLADHVVSWWNLHHEMDLHVMFLTYESLQKDLKGNVLRISRFLGETLTEERAAVIAERCTFDRMKALSAAKKEYDSEMIYRQGITAGWKTRFTVAQSERVDAVYKEKMKDLDYQYEYD